jgi:hypothetical protein
LPRRRGADGGACADEPLLKGLLEMVDLVFGDCVQVMNGMEPASVDLVFGSPPYADARSYGIGAQRGCQEWIDWMLDVTAAAVRVSRGLVLWVCASVTRKWCYWPGPEGLLYEWWKRGGQCWRAGVLASGRHPRIGRQAVASRQRRIRLGVHGLQKGNPVGG